MPGTASTQAPTRANIKARPTANVRGSSLVSSTPVLFRLPTIPTAAAQDLASALTDSVASLPTAKLAAVSITAGQAIGPQASSFAKADTAEALPKTNGAAQRTWWEHWSSGIVLIVLIIALATASILAWQGKDASKSKLIADTNHKPETLSSLSAIEVPKLDLPKLSAPAAASTASQASETSLIPSEPMALSFDSTLNSASSRTLPPVSNESHATASLQSPVVKPQEPLFKEDAATALKPNVTAQPASTPSQRNANGAGASPSMWDSSKGAPKSNSNPSELELASNISNASGLSSQTANAMSVGSNSNTDASAAFGPSAAADYSATQGNKPTGTAAQLVSQTTGDSALNSSSANAAGLVPSNIQYAAKTSTPEMDRAALFATYRQYDKSVTQIEATANRYKSAPPSAEQPANSGAMQGSSIATAGFAQQPSGASRAASSYTLPSPTNSAAPGYAALGYVAPQYQSAVTPNGPYQNQPQAYLQPTALPSPTTPAYATGQASTGNYSAPVASPNQAGATTNGVPTGSGYPPIGSPTGAAANLPGYPSLK